MSDSDSDDEYLKSKKAKGTGIRGRRGLKKKSSSQTSNPSALVVQTKSHIYSTKVSKCFTHIEAHDYDAELEGAKKETMEMDVVDDSLTNCQRNTPSESSNILPDVLTLLDDDETIGATLKTPKKSETGTEVLSPSPPPPPTPPDSGGKSKRGGRGRRGIRGKKKLLQSVSNLTKDICSARRLLDENTSLQLSFTSPDGDACIIEADEVTVRVQYQGEIRRFAINADQPISVIMEEIAKHEGGDFYNVMLVHKDRILRPTDTPLSIKLHTADIIMCHIGENLNKSLNDTLEMDSPNLIELCVQSRNTRHREIIKIHTHQPLKVLMEEYARRVGSTMSSLQFSFDGEVISPTETPDSLEMEDGECIDANFSTQIVLD